MKTNLLLDTINVLECPDGVPDSIRSFPNTADGNDVATELFKQCILENQDSKNPVDEEELQAEIEDGRWHDGFGYEIFLILSSA